MHNSDILVVDDGSASRRKLVDHLKDWGYAPSACPDPRSAKERLESQEFGLIIIDLKSDDNSLALLAHIKDKYPYTEVIIITAYGSVNNAVQAMKLGAFHYRPKPYKPDDIRLLIHNAIEKRVLKIEVMELRGQMAAGKAKKLPSLIGKSQAIQELKKDISRIAPLDCTVLVHGETGTGKEMVSRIIHQLSPRNDKKFLAVNCGALSEELLSNELFGHEKEAFTGAQHIKKGVFEACHGGTLLLDEIGDMPAPMQVQMLRVLQEKKVMRVGGTEELPVDVRVIAATHRDLQSSVDEGTFRQDLYFRLNIFTLKLPPLRERADDIPLFCHYFLDKYAREFHKEVDRISPEVMDILSAYDFPGNVRQLQNIIERALVLCDGNMIERKHLPQRFQGKQAFKPESFTRDHLIPLAELEKRYITDVLRFAEGNKTKTAEILGIDRVSLWRRLKKYNLES